MAAEGSAVSRGGRGQRRTKLRAVEGARQAANRSARAEADADPATRADWDNARALMRSQAVHVQRDTRRSVVERLGGRFLALLAAAAGRARLAIVGLHDLLGVRRVVRLLVVAEPAQPQPDRAIERAPNETRESQRDAAPTGQLHASARHRPRRAHQGPRGAVDGALTQIGGEDLPDVFRLEEDVRLGGAEVEVALLGALERMQRGVVRLEHLLREAGADLADGLVRLRVGVVAREEEGAVDGGALAAAVVAADDDEVERIADAGEVVLLDLQRSDQHGPTSAP